MPLTDQGFTPRTLQDIRDRIADNLRISLGSDIDTSPSSRIGQIIDVIADEIYDTELGLQDVYNSWFPNNSSGVSLDNVVSITNVSRRAAQSSQGAVYLSGSAGTSVSLGSVIQKTGTEERFNTQQNDQIVDTSNIVISEEIPTSGDITLSWDGESIAPINWDDNETDIENKIEAHSKIDSVQIDGTLSTARTIHILFESDTLTDRTPTIEDSTLQRDSEDVTSTAEFSNDNPVPVLSINTGEITVPVNSLTTIVTNVINWNAVINIEQGITGRERETDAELRDRREQDLQNSTGATAGGVKQGIQDVSGVTSVTIVENDTSEDDAEGRPPHSFECYVEGGDDDEVAQAIYDAKPLAITVAQTSPNQRSGNFTDVNGDNFTLDFSEPISVPMSIQVTGEQDTESQYPSDGDQQIKDALLAFFDQYELGQDVLNHTLYTPVNTVPGIRTLTIAQTRKVDGVFTSENTEIAAQEVATLLEEDITVNIT